MRRSPAERGAGAASELRQSVSALMDGARTQREQPKERPELSAGRMVAKGGQGEQVVLDGVPEHWDAREGSDGALILGLASQPARSAHEVVLAGAFGGGCRFLALSRCKLWWMAPSWGEAAEEVPPETQAVALKVGALCCAVVPLVEGQARASLVGREGGGLKARVETGNGAIRVGGMGSCLAVALGRDPWNTMGRALRAGREETGTFTMREEKAEPAHQRLFGWCTWDAFYREVSPFGLNEGLHALREGGCPPRFVILDDGWQQACADQPFRSLQRGQAEERPSNRQAYRRLKEEGERHDTDPGCHAAFYWRQIHTLKSHTRLYRACMFALFLLRPLLHCMYSFYAAQAHRLWSLRENSKFEPSLAAVVEEAKQVHGIRLFYVWHALLGYWAGLNPRSPHLRKYRSRIRWPRHYEGVLEVEASMAWDPVTTAGTGLMAPEACGSFYWDYHSYLASAGVDGVKVDAQALVGTLGRGWNQAGPEVARQVHGAMEDAASRALGPGRTINCMCHTNENFLHFGRSSAARVSDDYFPRDLASHTAHIANVAFNTFLLGHIVFPDWDMFQTTADGASLHAAARATGGCAVYVSDEPHHHDFETLRRMVLPNGATLVAERPGIPTPDCLFHDVMRDRRTPLKVRTRNRKTLLLGAFNVQGSSWDPELREYVHHDPCPPSLSASLRPADCLGEESDGESNGEYVAYLFRAGRMAVCRHADEEAAEVGLEPGGWELATFSPVVAVGNGAKFAAIGLGGMMNCGGAVADVRVGEAGVVSVELVNGSCGFFLAYCTSSPRAAYCNGSASAIHMDDSGLFQAAVAPSDKGTVVLELLFF